MDVKSLGLCSGYELRVIGFLSDIWPFPLPDGYDPIDSAAHATKNIKAKYADFWEAVQESNTHPSATAEMIVDIMLR